MKKYWTSIVAVTLVLLCFTLPVSAGSSVNTDGVNTDGGQGGGGVRFGPYTLSAGDSVSGDLTVFGPVTLNEDSLFDGDLTVFGEVFIESGATVDGTLVVMGALELAGTVDGDVFTAGDATLEDGAYISGDLSAVGTIIQDEESEIGGAIIPLDESELDWNMPAFPNIEVKTKHQPFFVKWFWNSVKALFLIAVMGIVALVMVSIWPQQVERVSQVIESVPLTAFGVGLLTLFLGPLGLVILAITLCLSPFSIIGFIILGIGILLGFIALGAILGQRIWAQLVQKTPTNPVISAVFGTMLLALLLAIADIFWPLYTLLVFLLIPLAAGAVLLTRFGTVPYASNGKPLFASLTSPTSSAPVTAVGTATASDVMPTNVVDDVSNVVDIDVDEVIAAPVLDIDTEIRMDEVEVENVSTEESENSDFME